MRNGVLPGSKISKSGKLCMILRSLSSQAAIYFGLSSYQRKSYKLTGLPFLRLNMQGHPIGLKLLDLLIYREPARSQVRPLHIIALLQFITTVLWKHLFARPADLLEKSANPETPDDYMISD